MRHIEMRLECLRLALVYSRTGQSTEATIDVARKMSDFVANRSGAEVISTAHDLAKKIR